jgi:hypothetical protein
MSDTEDSEYLEEGDSESDITEDEFDEAEEDEDERSVTGEDNIFPVLNIDPKSMNPATKNAGRKKN